MKLVTFECGGRQRLGALYGNEGIIDLAQVGARQNEKTVSALASMQALIDAGEAGLDAARRCFDTAKSEEMIPLADARLHAPLPCPIQIRDFMVFEKHFVQALESVTRLRAMAAKEDPDEAVAAARAAGALDIPPIWYDRPVYYKANRFAVTGPDEPVTWPAYSHVMDYEFEIACVIGKGGRDIHKDNARDHIFGFTIFNDLSARDAQSAEIQSFLGPAKGKDFDKGNPMGPCLVTIDEIDPDAIDMITRINGKEVARGSTQSMHWSFEDMIAWVSQSETLYPGEILGSGTVGDGCGLERMNFLQDGDIIELDAPQIGVLKTTIVGTGGDDT